MTDKIPSLVVLAVGILNLFAALAGVAVFFQSFRRMRADKADFLNVGGYVGFIVSALVGTLSLAALGNEWAFKVITEGATGIAWMFGSILGTLVGLPQIGKFAKGDNTVEIQKVETVTKKTSSNDEGGTT